MASRQARSRARIAAARATSSSTCCWVRTRLRAAEARSAAATMRSRSSTATSISSGPMMPPTSAPRRARSTRSPMRRSRRSSFSVASSRWAPAGHERDLVARALDPGAYQRDPLGRLGRSGRERGARLQGAGQRVEQPARLGEAHRERAAGRQRQVLGRVGVEPPVDERREPLGLDGPDAAAVEGRLEQREPVADGLPEGQRDGEVVGDRDLLGLRQLEHGAVDLAEVGPALGDPLAQGVQVGLRLGGLDGHAEAPGRRRGDGARVGVALRHCRHRP